MRRTSRINRSRQMKIIDLTFTLDNDCMTCGTPWHEKVNLRQLGRMKEVGRNTSCVHLGSHSGTHMDAPAHFYDNMYGIDKISLEQVCGKVSIVDFTKKYSKGDIVKLCDIEKIPVTPRMIFVFGWSKYWKTERYYDAFPYFTQEAVQYLIKGGMRVMALDTPSPDNGSALEELDDSPNHKMLLKERIVLIEYLANTDKLLDGKEYSLIALPLKLKDADGSPARVIALEH